MKKLLATLVVLSAFVCSAFAFEAQVGADVTFPIDITKPEGYTKSIVQTNFGFELNADLFFTDMIGMGVDFDFSIPLKQHYDGQSSKVNQGDYKQTGFGFAIGPSFRVLNNDKVQLVLTPGFDVSFISVKYKILGYNIKGFQTNFGIGGDVKFDYKFNDKVALDAGVNFAYYFSYKLKETVSGVSHTTSGNPKTFTITPKLGVKFCF